MKKIIFSNEQINEMISLYVEHIWGTRQIGKKYSVSEKTINRVLKEKWC
jgi:DNA-binding transcriptional regulator LsrR (DeoR family)